MSTLLLNLHNQVDLNLGKKQELTSSSSNECTKSQNVMEKESEANDEEIVKDLLTEVVMKTNLKTTQPNNCGSDCRKETRIDMTSSSNNDCLTNQKVTEKESEAIDEEVVKDMLNEMIIKTNLKTTQTNNSGSDYRQETRIDLTSSLNNDCLTNQKVMKKESKTTDGETVECLLTKVVRTTQSNDCGPNSRPDTRMDRPSSSVNDCLTNQTKKESEAIVETIVENLLTKVVIISVEEMDSVNASLLDPVQLTELKLFNVEETEPVIVKETRPTLEVETECMIDEAESVDSSKPEN